MQVLPAWHENLMHVLHVLLHANSMSSQSSQHYVCLEFLHAVSALCVFGVSTRCRTVSHTSLAAAAAEHARRVARRIKKDNKRQAKIKEAGIDYEYDGLKSQMPKQSKRLKLA